MTHRPPARMPAPPELRAARRQLRTAARLLAQTERFLHDLPDRQCPTALLDAIRRFNRATGDAP
ncbi:hypothetical protein EA658_13890 [Pseudoxanthomonas winnipegensis]|uniref:Uncharacterized protein n=1 Tax=Pseudoxanthomonas winnipegensis TaxID=2480810 RepID=A0ABY1WB50_9GAMM|nr:hypothetical protein [Pseudoxanthomonas winnipegensis]TAA18232.1 hypothetical protein EA658_13890 [Pseudoxanthomonas winnipegensis]